MTNLNIFENLNSMDVNEKVEKKGKLSYLSWVWAWTAIKKKYPLSSYEVFKDEKNKPYVYDEGLGYMCFTKVTIEDQTLEMWLPVMDGANKAMKKESYEYETRYGIKSVAAASMFDINKTIMRCLVKNLAMFGLGLYIYAGEDLPEHLESKPTLTKEGFEYLIYKGTNEEIQKALSGREMTEGQRIGLSKKESNNV